MTISRKIALGFSLPLVILMVIGAVTYRTTAELIDRAASVTHTHEVIESHQRHPAAASSTARPACAAMPPPAPTLPRSLSHAESDVARLCNGRAT